MHRQKQQADVSVKQPRHHHFGATFLGDLADDGDSNRGFAKCNGLGCRFCG